MSENIPHSLGGFRGAFESEHGRKPTEQEIWNAAIRSWRDITRQKSDAVKELEEVIADLLMYAGDNGYSHIDYADTMRHAAALLQSAPDDIPDAGKIVAALPVGERYQYVCANGCGPCGVKLSEFEYSRTETLEGVLLDSKTQPQIVSACCGSEVDVYDVKADTYTDFQVVAEDRKAALLQSTAMPVGGPK